MENFWKTLSFLKLLRYWKNILEENTLFKSMVYVLSTIREEPNLSLIEENV